MRDVVHAPRADAAGGGRHPRLGEETLDHELAQDDRLEELPEVHLHLRQGEERMREVGLAAASDIRRLEREKRQLEGVLEDRRREEVMRETDDKAELQMFRQVLQEVRGCV